MGIDKIFEAIFQRDWGQAGIIDIIEILLNVVKLLLILGNVSAVALILWNSYGLINAYGNEESVTKAKKGIYAAITGIIIITLSYFIITFVYSWLTGLDAPSEIIESIPT